MTQTQAIAPVQKSVKISASPERAFAVFTAGIDGWWPREHHAGKFPLKKVIVEGRVGGRCYSEQVGGPDCEWGRVIAWDPPRRFVLAWQLDPQWQYEPELSKASEVEVRFFPEPGGGTRVELEHRHFERHGTGAETMRTAVDAPGGWSLSLERFSRATAG